MIVCNELLGYPCLKIYQDNEMFHFSIDSVLLADFINVTKKDKKIIDLCGGNAPIPLYLTLKTDSLIDSIEIQEEIYKLAIKSIEENQLQNQINFVLGDVKDAPSIFGTNKYDIISCNPPFFKVDSNSNLNKNDYLTIARHEVKLTLEDVVSVSAKMLKDGGKLYLVYPPTRLQELFVLLEKYKLNLTKLQLVYPKRGTRANHVLIEAKKGLNKNKNLIILKPLYIYRQDGKWTKDILGVYNFKKNKENKEEDKK